MFKVLVGVIFLGIVSFYYGMEEDSNRIKIGFLGGLSGKYSNLGHSLLDGMTLAFEEENYKINGKEIEIISKDDRQKTTFVKLAMEEFKKEDVSLILGSGTSSMTKVALETIDKNYNPILISASASSSLFSKKDDNFFRTQVSQSIESFEKLSKHLIENNIKNIYTIYDSKNKAYSESYANNFEKSFILHGGTSFVSVKEISKDFSFIFNDIKEKKELDAVIIIANTIDTAKLVQYLRINGLEKLIIGSSWSKSSELLEDGGKYVENMLFLTSYNNSSQAKKYLDFVRKYEEKYKSTPSVFASQAYETAKIIIKVLKHNEDLNKFKDTILTIKSFEGLQGIIEFDEYGDIRRDYILMTIKNGRYEPI
ncbi:ABC transporter substrate-binding protein [Halarcobacter bivalviorum]|uniref:ABC transporter substrate-binding protein n=1 Tax=Halarcobacter bivalviorum TaxID=663364 RepID=UPI00100B315C|nr:ABC transporter substrate-binding protein [Halarcobacter bivalviorum]RXK03549.1 hypothetical protein CRU97_11940 [Halarcobacter bivalviorum]